MALGRNGNAHIIGGGIAGLASAVYLIRDGGMPGENISLYEEGRDADRKEGRNAVGGALDAEGDANMGYVMRGGRMFEEHYVCTYDLLKEIPISEESKITCKEDIRLFSEEKSWRSTARLVGADGRPLDVSSMGFDMADRWALLRLVFRSERDLDMLRIDQVVPAHFFETNFWWLWASMFSFQPWHSAAEFRRYLLRFIHLFPTIGDLSCVQHTRLTQYHSMIQPIEGWLKRAGVHFERGVCVRDLVFEQTQTGRRVSALKTCISPDKKEDIKPLGADDVVILTNGSMTDAATLGSKQTAPPAPKADTFGGAWTLWETLAEGRPEFGRPQAFKAKPEDSEWLSFTVTTQTPLFRELIEKLTGRAYGTEGLITFRDSKWKLTIHPYPFPAYPNQSEGDFIWWGYGLVADRKGNFVRKTMSDCSGEELLTETFRLLKFDDHLDDLIKNSKVISCMMPLITSQFLPRKMGDRPAVIPKNYDNLAFVGQYAEAPDDVVFTVEYSVRTAKMAVNSLLNLDASVPSIYKGYRNLAVILRAIWISFR
jgi:oleate hydratase